MGRDVGVSVVIVDAQQFKTGGKVAAVVPLDRENNFGNATRNA